MAITIERTGNPAFPWRVSKLCEGDAEFIATIHAMEAMLPPQAFAPAIAKTDGFPVTGGGESSAELPPAVEELMARGDEEAPTAHLKAGEAVQ